MNNRFDDNLVHSGANKELVGALVDNGVRFMVIGGLAVAWHCPARQADDMDLLIDPSTQNSMRVAAAFTRLGLHGYSHDSFALPGLQIPLKQYYYADLLTPSEDSPDFLELEAEAVDGKLFNYPVRVASVQTLIYMKTRAAWRDPTKNNKHVRDIGLLQDAA